MGHDEEGVCECVSEHRPRPVELHVHHIWPLFMGGGDTEENRIWRCPTSHANVHEVLRLLVKQDGVLSGEQVRRYRWEDRRVAMDGWKRWRGQGSTLS